MTTITDEQIEALRVHVTALSAGCCTCHSKSPGAVWHDVQCKVHNAAHALDWIDRLADRLDADKARIAELTRERDEARDEAVEFVFDAMERMLSVSVYRDAATETWEGDVSSVLRRVLYAAKAIDEEDGTLAADRIAAAEATIAELQAKLAASSTDGERI